ACVAQPPAAGGVVAGGKRNPYRAAAPTHRERRARCRGGCWMNTARVNGIDIAYTIEPGAKAGRPWMVFSHSLAADHSMWWPQVDEFAKSCNVLRYDTRGHGASSAPEGAYTLDLLADDLLQLLGAVGIERCHFVGLSMGGMIGQTAVLRDPR